MNKLEVFVLFLIVCLDSTQQWTYQKYPYKYNFESKKYIYKYNRMATTTVTPAIASDPCAPYHPPLPNFTAPGRKISEVKCFEYIWKLKVREDIAQRKQNCSMLRSRSGSVLNVVGGHKTDRGEFPHMGAIGWKSAIASWKFLCGCSLLSPRFVLTAAHCSRAPEGDTTIADTVPKIVRLGDRNIADEDEKGTTIKHYDVAIINIIIHPNYKPPKQYFDIALMKLGEVVEFSMEVQPGCLWTTHYFDMQSQEAEVAGWGVTEARTLQTSTELLAAQVDFVNTSQCDKLLRGACNRKWCGVQEHQLCAGKLAGGVDSCQGDSGGSLSVKIPLPITQQGRMHFIVGVTSFGISCGLPELPGVYTRVSSFVDWIETIVWPNGSDDDDSNMNKINYYDY